MVKRPRRKGLLAWVGAMGASATLAALVPATSRFFTANAANPAANGMVCTSNTDATTHEASFLITAKTGYITVADNNALFMWSYANGNGGFQHPGPVLCVEQGDHVTITLSNKLAASTSLQFPGMKDVRANGGPSDPVFDNAGNLQSLAPMAAPNGTATYSFTANDPGTFLYESGTDPDFQVQMGLFGVIVVRPQVSAADQTDLANFVRTGLGTAADASTSAAALADNPGLAYSGHRCVASDVGNTTGASAFCQQAANTGHLDPGTLDLRAVYSRNHEYLMLLSEVDPDLHAAVKSNNITTSAGYKNPYHAHYFLINGRSFPDNISPNGAAWLPTQPYGAMASVLPYEAKTDAAHDAAANPLPAMIHYAAVGRETYPMHPHSNHERVIIWDGGPARDGSADLSEEHFAIVMNPGATADSTFEWTNVEDYTDTLGARVPVPVQNGLNLTEGEYWSGAPYLGTQQPLNPGIASANACGEYYHVVHSHNLTQATNYGATFGGMLSLIRVDPARHANGTPRCTK